MSSKFRHLAGANEWPGLSTVEPFGLQVTFDPYLWAPGTRIKLCRVPWASSYEDVVDWGSDADRDAYFDALPGPSFSFETEIRVLPQAAIKLPIPFEVINNFNYLYIDFATAPVDYAATSSTRFFFFVEDVAFSAPSTSTALLTLDEWTTHSSQVTWDFIDLERGHAPMAALDAATYLSNPIEHTRLLGVADEATGAPAGRVTASVADVINAGPHWACIVMSCDPAQDLGTKYSPGWRTAIRNDSVSQGALGWITFAVEPAQIGTLLGNIDALAPQAKPSIMSVFLVPKRLVRVAYDHVFFGVTAHYLDGAPKVEDLLVLDQEKFGYPTEYRAIAKLYTSPYAKLDIIDERGRRTSLRIEDTTGRIQLSVAASIVAPMIGIDAHVVGIGGQAGGELTWANFTDHTFGAYGDFAAAMMHWDLPTYAVFQDAGTAYEYETYWGRQQQQAAIDSSYAVREAQASGTRAMTGENVTRRLARLAQQQASDSAQLGISRTHDARMLAADETKLQTDAGIDSDLALALVALQNEGVALAASQSAATGAIAVSEAETSYGMSELSRSNAQISQRMTTAGAYASIASSAIGVAEQPSLSGAMSHVEKSISSAQKTIDSDFSATLAEGSSALAAYTLQGARLSQVQAQATYALQMSSNANAATESVAAAALKVNAALDRLEAGYNIAQSLASASLAQQQATQNAIEAADCAMAIAQADRIRGLATLNNSTAKAQGEAAILAGIRSAALSTPTVIQGGRGTSQDITRPQAVWAQVVTQDAGSIATAGDAMLRYGYRFGGRQWRRTSLSLMRRYTYWEGRIRVSGGEYNEITRRVIEGIFSAGVTVWRRPEYIGRTSIYDNMESE